MSGHSKACCTLPPITTSKYEPNGETIKLAGIDAYTVGPPTATTAIIDVYDIFGMALPTLQGADRLSAALNALVIVPDFFKGNALDVGLFPPDTPEKMKIVRDFLGKEADVDTNKVVLLKVVEEAKTKWTGIESWAALGLCWGGKMVAVTSGPGTPFKVSGQVHPGKLEDSDAEAITIPHIVLFSKEDGTPEAMKSYGDILLKKKENYVENYAPMHHGWMGARADLEDEANAKEFVRGYDKVASFFAEHL